MEAAKQGESLEVDGKKKRAFWKAFINFLAMGGFLVVLIAIVAIALLISYLTK